MIRGTTPTVMFHLNGLAYEDIKKLYLTFEHGTKQLTKTEYEYDKRVYSVKLTQEETLLYSAGTVKVQVKVLLIDGTVVASPIKTLSMTDILMEEVVK